MADLRDALTQLYDRGSFDRYLRSSVGEAGASGDPLALVMADIDHFKRVNDAHGHPVGDAVLTAVASILMTVVRTKGECFRYGGEELAIILPNHSLNEALAVTERMRLEIESARTASVAVTVSFGVACLPRDGADSAALVKAADEALYDAKNRGRNLVRYFGEPEPPRPGPREPERKSPDVDGLTTEQRKAIRQSLLRRKMAECPNDGAYLEVEDFTPFGSAIREFFILCPGCGLTATLTGDDA